LLNSHRAAKKLSAILSWENTKKASIEAELKKIEVISFSPIVAFSFGRKTDYPVSE
jgi:hypothetical protein